MTDLRALVKEWQEAGKEWFAWARDPEFMNFKSEEAEAKRTAVTTRMANAEAALRSHKIE